MFYLFTLNSFVMKKKVLITFVKDGDRVPQFMVVNISDLSKAYAEVLPLTTSPVTISPVVEYFEDSSNE